MDIKREQLESSKDTGYITVQVNEEPAIRYEKVLFKHVGSKDIGGVLVAYGEGRGIVQVPYSAKLGSGSGPQTIGYRTDYHPEDFNLVHTDANSVKHEPDTGTVTVAFEESFSKAEGKYSFTTSKGHKVKGEFKLTAY